MPQKYVILLLTLFGLSIEILSCTSSRIEQTEPIQTIPNADVFLFSPIPAKYGSTVDIDTYRQFVRELGLSSATGDYRFINTRGLFFEKDGKRKFKVLIITGGEPARWFKSAMIDRGITCRGVKNILDFIKSGGSVIALCNSGSSLFSSSCEWLNPNLKEAQRGEWSKTHSHPGHFYRVCGSYAFKGTVRAPQESNRPYPTTKFLPIKMNPQNEIVQEANLPSLIHLIVVGGGSLIPAKDQPLDVVGWYSNGTVAIGIVPYGNGRIILCNPHPNISGLTAERWRLYQTMWNHAKRWGWTEEMIDRGRTIIDANRDPDGPEPDWALAKAMLSYAYNKALQ